MKPLFRLSVALLIAATIVQSCKKSSPEPEEAKPEEATKLVLTASTDDVEIDKVVTFTVTTDGKAVSDATIYIDGAAIEGYSHSFTEKGSYAITAKKENTADSDPLTVKVYQEDVYVAGYEIKNDLKEIGKYWKNGVEFELTSILFQSSKANSIFVSGTDVYVAGREFVYAKYWKNNEKPIKLTDASQNAVANSVFVSGTDVYVAGYETNGTKYDLNKPNVEVAKYWKNDEAPIELTDGSKSAIATSIFVSGTDVYVAGGYEDGEGQRTNYIATYWKNREAFPLTDGSQSFSANARSIFVSGDDVYVAGYEYNETKNKYVATYWKNGTAIRLPNNSERKIIHAEARSIFVSGTDVYIVGYAIDNTESLNHVATYWKNGTLINLTGESQSAQAHSIFVSGTDVYIAGYENIGTKNVATYWKNGVATYLTDGSNHTEALSIYVAKSY